MPELNGTPEWECAESNWERINELGDQHLATAADTPMRTDAFELDDETKIRLIESHFRSIMDILGLDLTDDSLNGTPYRVAKMYVKEIFHGLNPANHPVMTLFDNHYGYHDMLTERNITLQTNCEHHFLPIIGKAHVAYIPGDKVIGLSKLNRIVQYYAKRPQVQERLTMQIANALRTLLQTEDVAVLIDAAHACVSTRGIQDTASMTITTKFYGKFESDPLLREQFLRLTHTLEKP